MKVELVMNKPVCRNNNDFLQMIEPYRKNNIVNASAGFLCNLTSLSRPALYRYLYDNDLHLMEGVKYSRKCISQDTQRKILYIRKRLQKDPNVSLQTLAAELGVSRQCVSQMINRYGLRHTDLKTISKVQLLELV